MRLREEAQAAPAGASESYTMGAPLQAEERSSAGVSASRAAGTGPPRPSQSCGLAPSTMFMSLQEERRALAIAPASEAPGAESGPCGSCEQEVALP